MSISFLPTTEQEILADYFMLKAGVIKEEDFKWGDFLPPSNGRISDSFIVPVEAPAGVGKTNASIYIMEKIQELAPEKRIGYFIFNGFMKDEVQNKAWHTIMNTDFSTYHSFMLSVAKNREDLHKYFYVKGQEGDEDVFRVNPGKLTYEMKEIKNVVKVISQSQDTNYQLNNLFYSFLNQYFDSPYSLREEASRISKLIFNDDFRKTEEEKNGKKLSTVYDKKGIIKNRKEIGDFLFLNKKAMISRLKNKNIEEQSSESLCTMFLMQATQQLLATTEMTMGACYKQVAVLAEKLDIDIFEEYDIIMIDEIQDLDLLIKKMITNLNKRNIKLLKDTVQPEQIIEDIEKTVKKRPVPVLLIGDRAQSIYGFRGAENVLEEMVAKYRSFSLSYSFRFYNDIAMFCNNILQNKENPPEFDVIGRYTNTTKNINEDLVNYDFISDFLIDKVEKRVGNGDISVELYLAYKEKKEFENTRDKERTQLESEMSDDEKKIFRKECKEADKGEYNLKTSSMSEEEKRAFEEREKEKLTEGRKAKKAYRKFMAKEQVAFIARNNVTLLDAIFNILPKIRESDCMEHISISLTSKIVDDFKAVRRGEFDAKTTKAIDEILDVKYYVYRNKLKGELGKEIINEFPLSLLDKIFENQKIRNIVMGFDKYAYLFDPERRKQFEFLLNDISSRSEESISSSVSNKKNKDANLIFTTVHGAKGMDYMYCFLGNDLLKPDADGVISEEEYNLAYVAVSRAIASVYFAEGDKDTHYLQEYFKEHKESILEKLKKSYTYVFPNDVHMQITELSLGGNSGFFHLFLKDGEILGGFSHSSPISMGKLCYDITKNPFAIEFYDSSNRGAYTVLSLEGKNIKKNKYANLETIGGENNSSDSELMIHKLNNLHKQTEIKYFGVGGLTENIKKRKKKKKLEVHASPDGDWFK